VRSKYKQNWINHLERMDNTRLPKYSLSYKPRGRMIGDAPGDGGNASCQNMPNPWKKKKMRRRSCSSHVPSRVPDNSEVLRSLQDCGLSL